MLLMQKSLLLLMLVGLSGCGLLIKPVTQQFSNNLSQAILNQTDPETVREALPAYLILMDSMIVGEPEDESMLIAAAKLNSSYDSLFVEDPARSRRITEKALNYAQQAFCLSFEQHCTVYQQPFEQYAAFLNTTEADHINILYSLATTWLNWIKSHSDDWMARADLPKVKATLERVIELDKQYQNGEPLVYLGVMDTLLPPALGGKPEQAKAYFQQAIALSDHKNLLFQVIYAERYARLMFDRPLHDSLLRKVLSADPNQPGLTLINTLAQNQAQLLLNSADDYF